MKIVVSELSTMELFMQGLQSGAMPPMTSPTGQTIKYYEIFDEEDETKGETARGMMVYVILPHNEDKSKAVFRLLAIEKNPGHPQAAENIITPVIDFIKGNLTSTDQVDHPDYKKIETMYYRYDSTAPDGKGDDPDVQLYRDYGFVESEYRSEGECDEPEEDIKVKMLELSIV